MPSLFLVNKGLKEWRYAVCKISMHLLIETLLHIGELHPRNMSGTDS